MAFGVAAEIVVAARAFREGDDLHLAVVGLQLDDGLASVVGRLRRRLAAVETAGVDRLEREVEPA